MHRKIIGAIAGATTLFAPLVALAAPAQAAYPGANRYVAYTINYGSAYNIFRQFRDGTGKKKLTTDGKSFGPVFSPNGKKIAYDDGGTLGLMNADGTSKHKTAISVAGYYGSDQSFSWSPDGTKIAVVTPKAIKVFTSTGTLKKVLLTGNGYSRVSFNPANADQVLINDRTIYHIASRSYSTVAIDPTSPEDRVSSVNWMPNGSILFVSNCDRNGACTDADNIFVASVSGGTRTNMTGRTDENQQCTTGEDTCNTIDEALSAPDGRDFLYRGNEGSGAGVEFIGTVHSRVHDFGDPFNGGIYLGDWQGS